MAVGCNQAKYHAPSNRCKRFGGRTQNSELGGGFEAAVLREVLGLKVPKKPPGLGGPGLIGVWVKTNGIPFWGR